MLSSRAMAAVLILTFTACGVACCADASAPSKSPVGIDQSLDRAKKSSTETTRAIDEAISGLKKLKSTYAAWDEARKNEQLARTAALNAAFELIKEINEENPPDAGARDVLKMNIDSKLTALSKATSEMQHAHRELDAMLGRGSASPQR
jgi:hypothetical protein